MRGIIVLNKSYATKTEKDSCPVGATSFTQEVINSLEHRKKFLGIILYARKEDESSPVVEKTQIWNKNAVIIYYNTTMKKNDIKAAFVKAAYQLGQDVDCKNIAFYYQTDVLLPYHPEEVVGIVTHHGPFVSDVRRNYGDVITNSAFGGKEKAEFLNKSQIESLSLSNGVFNLEHSDLQKKLLMKNGIEENKIIRIPPPIRSFNDLKFTMVQSILPDSIKTFVLRDNTPIITTAVARLDEFKHIDLLVNSCVALLKLHVEVKVIIIGGAPGDSSNTALLSLIPDEMKRFFLFESRLDQYQLHDYFQYIKNKSIFVCTSRYETCGITPLEAASNGLTTLMVNSSQVEASQYFNSKYKYEPNEKSLGDLLIKILTSKVYQMEDVEFVSHIKKHTSINIFRESFINAWGVIEQHQEKNSQVRHSSNNSQEFWQPSGVKVSSSSSIDTNRDVCNQTINTIAPY